VGAVLSEGALDPTIVVGGKVSTLGSNARLGHGPFLVAEADESDGSFLYLTPTISVITNIDREHMDHYGTEEAMESAFVSFAAKVPFYGAVVVCLDDPRIRALMPCFTRRTVTYGLSGQVDVSARHIRQEKGRTRFEIIHRGTLAGEVDLSLPGIHNVLNSLAAFAVGVELDVDPKTIIRALSGFSGVDRRSEVKGEAAGVLVIDDYGHHPTEVMAALKGLREAYDRRIVALFQPHRFSRTQDLAERFHTAFYDADILFVADIYPAGEKPIPGVDSKALAEGIRTHGHRSVEYAGTLENAGPLVSSVLKGGDLFVTLGAGNVWQVGEALLANLAEGSK
jgi:UDP-N-acetylmuramate--alanine ligase